jgi:hypothetical protein
VSSGVEEPEPGHPCGGDRSRGRSTGVEETPRHGEGRQHDGCAAAATRGAGHDNGGCGGAEVHKRHVGHAVAQQVQARWQFLDLRAQPVCIGFHLTYDSQSCAVVDNPFIFNGSTLIVIGFNDLPWSTVVVEN